MRCSKGFARVRPLMFLALAAATGLVVAGNASQAMANRGGNYLRCYSQCQKVADRTERQCLQKGGDAATCDAQASAEYSDCLWSNGCYFWGDVLY